MIEDHILGMKVNPLTYSRAADQIERWLASGGTRFVSICSVNNVVAALRSPNLMKIENSADMVTTDGMPLVWHLRRKGHRDCARVYGPTLMLQVLERATQKDVPVYFYGCTDDVLEKLGRNLLEKFPGLKIVGMFAPPFRGLTEEENAEHVQAINDSGARLVFVGISTPKQEFWMHRNRPVLENCVMLGVGAAFNFHAGLVRQAPAFIQRIGMEWFFRLVMEPRRLWRRYLFGNTYFLYRLFLSRFVRVDPPMSADTP
jgi:N-acetylglucosaminyldiphosphoundecaprenol N-acetyl-beta-D-mannosaminyltransferase